jgi:hypothetical protein
MKPWVLLWMLSLTGSAMLRGQDYRTSGLLYQVLSPTPFGSAPGSQAFGSNQVVRGKPFSATGERRTAQTLRDGTHINNGETNHLFRDSQGRTRIEEMSGVITIVDPVAGFRFVLDPSTKTARREISALSVIESLNGLVTQLNSTTGKAAAPETSVSLKPQVVNGIMAQGARTTMVIPKGQIGNDREIKVVTETWVSSDLQLLVKSTNTDPRYGETTYQLAGIMQREPDPMLFQIPADYTVLPDAGRGGRSPIPGGRSPIPGGRSTNPPGRRGPDGRRGPADSPTKN